MIHHIMRCRSLILAALIGGAIAWPLGSGHAAPAPASKPMHTAVAKAIPGWPGAASQYLGRYHLTSSSDPALATGGELTVFLRKVPPMPKPLLSGILSLTTKNQTNVVYLTKFMHAGTKLWTTVNLGIYTGPVLGQFKVTSIHDGQLVAEIVQKGAAPVTLQLMRFSMNPHP
jgi:hypothetical protein